MNRFWISARLPTMLALGAVLAISGCDDEPQVPAEVERLARQREEADERALEELERKRNETAGTRSVDEPPPSPPPPDKRSDAAGTPPVDADTLRDEGTAANKTAEPPAIPVSPVVPPKSPAAMRWLQLKAGMTTEAVVELLGKPTSISSDVFVDYWTYGQGRAAGRVAFIRLSRMTIAWDPPID
jgi:hypothetical protein